MKRRAGATTDQPALNVESLDRLVEQMPHETLARLRERYAAAQRALVDLVGPEFADWDEA